MACQTQEKVIKLAGEERTLTVTQLPAMRAVKLFTRLGRLVGPSVALILKGAPDKDGHVQVEETKLGDAVRELFAHLTEAEIEHLITELLFTTEARIEIRAEDGTATTAKVKDVFASEFAGELGAIAQAVAFGLQVNFGNFFAGLGALRERAEKLIQATGPASKGSNTSAGRPNG